MMFFPYSSHVFEYAAVFKVNWLNSRMNYYIGLFYIDLKIKSSVELLSLPNEKSAILKEYETEDSTNVPFLPQLFNL